MTREAAFLVFAEAARRIWSNADTALRRTSLADGPPANRAVGASLRAVPRPARAIGDLLVVPGGVRFELHLADRLLALDAATIRAVLAHEAIHFGVPNHGADFRRLARLHGASISEAGGTDGRVRVQEKVGQRYQTVADFGTEDEARAWAREQARAEPGSRWRLSL